MNRKDFLIDDTIESFRLYFQEELSLIEIAKKMDIGYGTLNKIFDYHKIPRREPNDLNKISMREDFFEKINTEEKAYFLGWMYSDGNISKNFKTAKLAIHRKDEEIIHKLNNLIYFEPFYYIYRDYYVVLNMTRKKIIEDLIKQGCHPNKTFTIEFPTETQVPENLIPHFMRGYFDGDGSIGLMRSGYYYANLVGTTQFCQKFGNVIKKFDNQIEFIEDSINDKGTMVLRFTAKNPIRLGHYLYNNHSITLRRKFEKFKKILDIEKNRKLRCYNADWINKKNEEVLKIVNFYNPLSCSSQ